MADAVVSSGSDSGPDTCPADCLKLKNALVRRYRFDGSGSTVVDAQGRPAGEVVNAALTGNGTVVLAGGSSNQYVDLPNGIVSELQDATIVIGQWSVAAVARRLCELTGRYTPLPHWSGRASHLAGYLE